jgi:quinolinate synthase
MVRHARECPASADLVGTEVGLLYRLRKESPASSSCRCATTRSASTLRTTTLPKLYRALRDSVHDVRVEPDEARRARAAIDRMMETA